MSYILGKERLKLEAREFLKGKKPDRCDSSRELYRWISGAKAYNRSLVHGNAALSARLDLFIEQCQLRLGVVMEDEAKEKSRRNKLAAKLATANADTSLVAALADAISQVPQTHGYIYLRQWQMPDGVRWYKVGVTKSPDRRENEQNVLPVAAETLVCVDVGTMDRARSLEKAIHAALDAQRIRDANNKELFHLSDAQLAALASCLKKLEREGQRTSSASD